MSALSMATHAEAIVAGTLCLMSCYARTPTPAQAERIANNLAMLGNNPAVSDEMRTLCRRLAERWDALALEASREETAARRPQPAGSLH